MGRIILDYVFEFTLNIEPGNIFNLFPMADQLQNIVETSDLLKTLSPENTQESTKGLYRWQPTLGIRYIRVPPRKVQKGCPRAWLYAELQD